MAMRLPMICQNGLYGIIVKVRIGQKCTLWLVSILLAIAAIFAVIAFKNSKTTSMGFMMVPKNALGKGYSVRSVDSSPNLPPTPDTAEIQDFTHPNP